MNFLRRVINIPEKLQTALLTALVAGAVWLEVWLGGLLGIDLTEQFTGLAAGLAVVIGFVAKAALERWVPEPVHPVVNSILVWIAGFFGALALLNAL